MIIKPKYYYTKYGVMGLLHDGKYYLFASDREYLEAFRDEEKEEN